MSEKFWKHLDQLIQTSDTVIDRPQRSAHPRYPDVIYPLDYGYLAHTSSADGDGIDVWVGSLDGVGLVGVIATIDLSKRDIELKLLINCSNPEIDIIMKFFASNEMGAHFIRRST